jgi:hypothetical protein
MLFDSPVQTPVVETIIVEWSNDGQWQLRNGEGRYLTVVTAMHDAETRFGKRFWIPKCTRTYEGHIDETR